MEKESNKTIKNKKINNRKVIFILMLVAGFLFLLSSIMSYFETGNFSYIEFIFSLILIVIAIIYKKREK